MDMGNTPNGAPIQNWSDWEAALAYSIAMDDAQPRGLRGTMRQQYEGKYGDINAGFAKGSPSRHYYSFEYGVVQPIVGGWLKMWSAVLGWFIGFGR
jgi:hypothetical protein